MIEYKKGNILQEDVEALVNTVNCMGCMGRGLALEFKRAWPQNFRAYVAACNRQEVRPGRMFVFETGCITNPRYIINFPTKRHWRSKSIIQDIEAGLHALVQEINKRGIASIALPALGAGLGGLDWLDVRRLIEEILGNLNHVRVIVYEPIEGPGKLPPKIRSGQAPKMTRERAVLIELMYRYIHHRTEGIFGQFISLLEIHQLLYFMHEAGEPLQLHFVRTPYGVYAPHLKNALYGIDDYFITGYGGFVGDIHEEMHKVIRLVPGAVEDAQLVLGEFQETWERIDRVSQLVEGLEAPYGLEILSTVHCILKEDKPVSEREFINRFYSWDERKSQFALDLVYTIIRRITDQGWCFVDFKLTLDRMDPRRFYLISN